MNPHNLTLEELIHAIDIGTDNLYARALLARIDEIREEANQAAEDLQGELDSLRQEYNDEEARADKLQKELYTLADAMVDVVQQGYNAITFLETLDCADISGPLLDAVRKLEKQL